jgi:hypothetical protein
VVSATPLGTKEPPPWSQEVAKTTPNGGLGVVLATPLGTKGEGGAKGVAETTPNFLSFFFEKKKKFRIF